MRMSVLFVPLSAGLFPRLYGSLWLFDGTPVEKNCWGGKEGNFHKTIFMELAHARFIYFHCWWKEYVVVNTFLFLTGGRHNWYGISVFLTLEVSYRNRNHRWRDSICIDGQIFLLWWRDSICLSSLIFLRFGGTAYKCIIVFWVPGDRWRDSICLLEHVMYLFLNRCITNVVLTLACRYISRNGCGYVENHEISLIFTEIEFFPSYPGAIFKKTRGDRSASTVLLVCARNKGYATNLE